MSWTPPWRPGLPQADVRCGCEERSVNGKPLGRPLRVVAVVLDTEGRCRGCQERARRKDMPRERPRDPSVPALF